MCVCVSVFFFALEWIIKRKITQKFMKPKQFRGVCHFSSDKRMIQTALMFDFHFVCSPLRRKWKFIINFFTDFSVHIELNGKPKIWPVRHKTIESRACKLCSINFGNSSSHVFIVNIQGGPMNFIVADIPGHDFRDNRNFN